MSAHTLDCRDAQDRLLEADSAELDGTGSSPLAIHVGGCAECAELGWQILEGQLALSGALADLADRIGGKADPAEARSEAVARGRRRRVVWRVAVPLAAAATGALALFQISEPASEEIPLPTVPEWALPLAIGARGTVVTSGPDERVAVLPTRNPNITVVWINK